jgi:photosystem II stability/assembly factor-like uncharacterized protein
MSSNGQIILVAGLGARVYITTNGGDSWTETQPGGDDDLDWYTISMSSNGQTILIGDHTGRLYLSNNSGSSWSEVQPAGNTDHQWRTTIVSDDEQVMFAGVDGGRLYRSIDGGDNWTEMRPAGDDDFQWSALGISSNTQTVLAANRYRLYRSTDGGDNWTEMRPGGDNELTWNFASVSSNGLTMFVSDGNRLYFSNHGGNIWSETQPLGATTQTWSGGAVSSNARVLITNIYNGRVFIGSNPPEAPGPAYSHPSTTETPTCNDKTPKFVPHLFEVDSAGTFATLNFTASKDNVSGYEINYGFNNSANNFGDRINGSESWLVHHTIWMLPKNANMYFKVRAVNGCTAGEWSNVIKIKTSHTKLTQFF